MLQTKEAGCVGSKKQRMRILDLLSFSCVADIINVNSNVCRREAGELVGAVL